jgi:thiamine kinase-like enzyme
VKSLRTILQLGKGWEITPAGGATGEAYIAESKDKKLFLKRNSSPFLAVLSAEGIVPKLIWTKRIESGDVISAQQWLDGRELKPADMKGPAVARLLSKIHHSEALLDMLKRITKTPLHSFVILDELKQAAKKQEKRYQLIERAIMFLDAQQSTIAIDVENLVVCHGDINHNNWLLSNENQLYLIDWDGARIADPALDLGQLLFGYIPESDWDYWLAIYGVELTPNLKRRMKWYFVSQTIASFFWHTNRGNGKEAQKSYHCLELTLKD